MNIVHHSIFALAVAAAMREPFNPKDYVCPGPKGSDGRSLLTQEENMKSFTRFELASRSTNELRALLRETFNELVFSRPDTAQRRNALASLETIRAELAARLDGP